MQSELWRHYGDMPSRRLKPFLIKKWTRVGWEEKQWPQAFPYIHHIQGCIARGPSSYFCFLAIPAYFFWPPMFTLHLRSLSLPFQIEDERVYSGRKRKARKSRTAPLSSPIIPIPVLSISRSLITASIMANCTSSSSDKHLSALTFFCEESCISSFQLVSRQ